MRAISNTEKVVLNVTDGSHSGQSYLRVVMVAKEMIHEGGARVTVTSNGHALVHPVSVVGNDVVEFIGHTTRPRHIGHTVKRSNR